MKRGLVWSAAARRDLLDIVHYIGRNNKRSAIRVADRINKAAVALAGRAIGRPGRVAGSYEKSLPNLPYILAYEIVELADGGEAIGILRVIHTARNWQTGQWPADET